MTKKQLVVEWLCNFYIEMSKKLGHHLSWYGSLGAGVRTNETGHPYTYGPRHFLCTMRGI